MSDSTIAKIESLKTSAKTFAILYVEDEKSIREKMTIFFNKIFDHVDVASNGEEGFEKYIKTKHDIVITDIQMPIMNGLDMISKIRELDEHQEVIVVSAYADTNYLTKCIQLGVTAYVIKPIDFDQIINTLEQSIYKLSAFRENEMYKTKLENMVEERTQSVFDLKNQQVENYEHAINSLVKMVEDRDSYTAGHSERVATYSRKIAKAMGLTQEECTLIYEAGILHDIGKIITPDAILLKPGQLSEYEYSLIKEHVTAGYNILNEIPMYEKLADIVYGHHEHYDGSGYPKGIKSEEIPLLSRIMMVADAFDAMTTSRIYKSRKSIDEAIEELQELSGIWYDPKVIESAVDIFKVVSLDSYVKQKPSTLVDDERFAYFYKDPLTKAYNQNYLEYIIKKSNEDKKNLHLNVLYLNNFSLYNKNYGWVEGDRILESLCAYFRSEFPESQIFRIFGDDFVLLHDVDIDINKVNSIDLLKKNNLFLEYRKFNLQRDNIKSYKNLEEEVKL